MLRKAILAAALFVTSAAHAGGTQSTPAPTPAHVTAPVARPIAPPVVNHAAPAPVAPAHAPELHLGPVAEGKTATTQPLTRLQKFIQVIRDPAFAVSVANFSSKTALAFSHQGHPFASAAAAALGITFAGLALARNPKQWGSLPWTTASLGFTGAAAAASLLDPSVSGYLFDAAVATALPGIGSAGKAALSPTPPKVASATH